MLSGTAATSEDRLVGADRVLQVLVELAGRHDGASLEQIANAVASPKPTVHRALTALVRAGLARKEAIGQYTLGDEFLRLAFSYHEANPDHLRVLPVLRSLAERFGETTHYAVLEGSDVVYRAKVDPPTGAVRLTSSIGGRNPAHCTAVGKLLLSHELADDHEVLAWAQAHKLVRRTPQTIVDAEELACELARIRNTGFAEDNQENEIGINCLAVPLRLGPGGSGGAVSVSALAYRTPIDSLVGEAQTILEIVQDSFRK